MKIILEKSFLTQRRALLQDAAMHADQYDQAGPSVTQKRVVLVMRSGKDLTNT